jgi:hypothetical protein
MISKKALLMERVGKKALSLREMEKFFPNFR